VSDVGLKLVALVFRVTKQILVYEYILLEVIDNLNMMSSI
jgi:hypothetical protein